MYYENHHWVHGQDHQSFPTASVIFPKPPNDPTYLLELGAIMHYCLDIFRKPGALWVPFPSFLGQVVLLSGCLPIAPANKTLVSRKALPMVLL
ncbi:unnamed protein product [Penicillium pancosmium]